MRPRPATETGTADCRTLGVLFCFVLFLFLRVFLLLISPFLRCTRHSCHSLVRTMNVPVVCVCACVGGHSSLLCLSKLAAVSVAFHPSGCSRSHSCLSCLPSPSPSPPCWPGLPVQPGDRPERVTQPAQRPRPRRPLRQTHRHARRERDHGPPANVRVPARREEQHGYST
jgi:hypothetical protein